VTSQQPLEPPGFIHGEQSDNATSHLQNFAKKVPDYSRDAPKITVSFVKE